MEYMKELVPIGLICFGAWQLWDLYKGLVHDAIMKDRRQQQWRAQEEREREEGDLNYDK